jgi:hypothetical protein
MFRVILLTVQILLVSDLCSCQAIYATRSSNGERLNKGAACAKNEDCLEWLSCSGGVCDQCLESDQICWPGSSIMKCCHNTTCEQIIGMSDGYSCRPNNNTCLVDSDCHSPGLKCISGKCGMCKEGGRPCSASPGCCGHCDESIGPIGGICVDGPKPATTTPASNSVVVARRAQPAPRIPQKQQPVFVASMNATIKMLWDLDPWQEVRVLVPHLQFLLRVICNETHAIVTWN